MKKNVLLLLVVTLLASPVWAKGKAKGVLTGQININEATVTQLTMLPGVGPARAQAIVEYRQAHLFQSAEELKKVKGIGDKGFEAMKPYVTIQGPTTAQWQKGVQTPAAAKPAPLAGR